jgi:DNA-binding NarL/FixJ family response regulator
VLVVARSPVVAAGLAALATDGGAQVTGTAVGFTGLGQRVEETRPDVVVAALTAGDALRLPPLAGDGPVAPPRLVAVAEDDDPETSARLLRMGAAAVLPPDVTAAMLATAVDAVAVGLAVLDAAALARLLAAAPARAAIADSAPRGPAVPLTPREQEVLALVAEGLGNREIALRLGISAHTAKAHVAAVLAKLGAATRAEAVAEGLRSGRLLL